MENEALYGLTVVDTDEFNILSQLPDYTRIGNCLTRLEGDILQIVMREDEHVKLQGYHDEMQADLVRQDTVIEREQLMSEEIAQSPSVPSDGIPAGDKANGEFYFSAKLPEHGESSRPRDRFGKTIDFGPLF
jgi:hypothetical protein